MIEHKAKWYAQPKEILQLMDDQDMNMHDLAKSAGISYATVRRVADPSYRKPISYDCCRKIASVFGRPLEEIASCEPGRRDPEAATVAKILDLTAYGTGDPEPETPLTCYYDFRRFPSSRKMEFHAATTSPAGLDIQVPRAWQDVLTIDVHPIELEDGTKVDKHDYPYCITAHLCEETDLEDVQFEYEIMFKDAYTDPDKWWYHAHLDFNADQLLMVVLFPASRTPNAVVGGFADAGTPIKQYDLKTHRVKPTLLNSGTMLLWRIPRPQQGQTYQLDWEW